MAKLLIDKMARIKTNDFDSFTSVLFSIPVCVGLEMRVDTVAVCYKKSLWEFGRCIFGSKKHTGKNEDVHHFEHVNMHIYIFHEYILSFLYIVFLIVSRIYKCDSSFTIQYWKVMIAFTCIMYLYSVYIIYRDSDAFPRCNCWYRTHKGDPQARLKSCHVILLVTGILGGESLHLMYPSCCFLGAVNSKESCHESDMFFLFSSYSAAFVKLFLWKSCISGGVQIKNSFLSY